MEMRPSYRANSPRQSINTVTRSIFTPSPPVGSPRIICRTAGTSRTRCSAGRSYSPSTTWCQPCRRIRKPHHDHRDAFTQGFGLRLRGFADRGHRARFDRGQWRRGCSLTCATGPGNARRRAPYSGRCSEYWNDPCRPAEPRKDLSEACRRERRAADISVDHPDVVTAYRGAQAIAVRDKRGEADTDAGLWSITARSSMNYSKSSHQLPRPPEVRFQCAPLRRSGFRYVFDPDNLVAVSYRGRSARLHPLDFCGGSNFT
jgi:hypothetical protein